MSKIASMLEPSGLRDDLSDRVGSWPLVGPTPPNYGSFYLLLCLCGPTSFRHVFSTLFVLNFRELTNELYYISFSLTFQTSFLLSGCTTREADTCSLLLVILNTVFRKINARIVI